MTITVTITIKHNATNTTTILGGVRPDPEHRHVQPGDRESFVVHQHNLYCGYDGYIVMYILFCGYDGYRWIYCDIELRWIYQPYCDIELLMVTNR